MGLGGPRAWAYLLKRDGGQDCSWGEGGATDTGGACRPPPRTAPPVSQDIPRLGTPTAPQPPPWVGGEWRPRVGQGHPMPTQPTGPPPDSWQALHHSSSPRLPLPYPSQARSPAQGPSGDPCLPQVSPSHQGTREGGGPRSQLWLGPPLPIPQAPASHAWTIQGSPGPHTETPVGPRATPRVLAAWGWDGGFAGGGCGELTGCRLPQDSSAARAAPGGGSRGPHRGSGRASLQDQGCAGPQGTGRGGTRSGPSCPTVQCAPPPSGGNTQRPLLSWTLPPASTSGSGTTPGAPWPSRPTALAMDQVRLAPPPSPPSGKPHPHPCPGETS